METSILQVILEHCIPPARLKRMMPSKPAGRDWYEAAADELLNETETGLQLSDCLDTESRPQKNKIHSMKVSELRENLSMEFLEPGRTLGLILWALMSDERLSARNLADQLAKQLVELDSDSETAEDETLLFETEPDSPENSMTLDQQIAEIDGARKIMASEEEPDDEDLDLDSLLEEIRDEEGDDEGTDEDIDDDLRDLLDEEEDSAMDSEFEMEDESSAGPVEINDELLDEVDTFIASLDEDEQESHAASEELNPVDELDTELLLDGVDFEEPGEQIDEEEDTIDFDFSGEEIEPADDLIEPIHLDEIDDGIDALDETIEPFGVETGQDEEEFEIPDAEATPVSGADETSRVPVPTVQLGGITISLTSLKRACETVFDEPVELVTDESLTRQDQIVVVGRNCGVRILHGPTWTQPIEPFREHTGEPVTISPVSLKLALSRIYDETIELIPDPNLLNSGMILFAGKSTGLGIMENLRTRVPLPEWSEGLIPVEEEPSSMDVEYEITDLREQISMLQSRLEALESAPVPAPVPAPAAIAPVLEEPVAEEPEPEPEPDIADGHIAETPISVDDIETEELEPIVETDLEDGGLDDEIMAAISDQEDDSAEDSEGAELGLGDVDLGEVDLDELNLNEFEEEPADEAVEEAEEEIAEDILEEDDEEALAEESEDEISDLDGIEGIEDLDLSDYDTGEEEISLGEEEISLGDDDIEDVLGGSLEDESSIGEEELSLDDLDLDSLGDYDTGEDTAVEEDEEEDGEEEPELEDVDLGDILSELDSDDGDTGDAPEPVFGGETVLLLGGDAKNADEYTRVIEEIGGNCLSYANLNDMPEGEIATLVEQADLIMTLSAEALSDPGILQATNYAEEQSKPVIQHHSTSPISVQKQLVKAVQEE